jgi:SAM-dependent methyltransferase
MCRAKTTWGAGEYPLMAQALEPASTHVVDAVNVSAGQRVIDVATGTGNAALLAAARGAHVLGIDTEPALLAFARHRASADLDVKWVEGDAEVGGSRLQPGHPEASCRSWAASSEGTSRPRRPPVGPPATGATLKLCESGSRTRERRFSSRPSRT